MGKSMRIFLSPHIFREMIFSSYFSFCSFLFIFGVFCYLGDCGGSSGSILILSRKIGHGRHMDKLDKMSSKARNLKSMNLQQNPSASLKTDHKDTTVKIMKVRYKQTFWNFNPIFHSKMHFQFYLLNESYL